MKFRFLRKKCFISRIKIEILFISIITYIFLNEVIKKKNSGNKNIKIAICTMGKSENLYIKEFIEYYIKLGIEHIFIYDDNEPNTERICEAIDKKYQNNVTVYDAKKLHIDNQSIAFSECYKYNNNKFDWLLMLDMDEFLYINYFDLN